MPKEKSKPKEIDKRAKFVDEYLKLEDTPERGPEAARLAGYANYDVQWSLLLKSPRVKYLIKKKRAEMQTDHKYTVDRVLEEYGKIAFVDPSDYFSFDSENGVKVKASHAKDWVQLDMTPIKGITESFSRTGKRIVKIDFYDKMEALKAIRDIMGYDTPSRTEHKNLNISANVNDGQNDISAIRERLARRLAGSE